MKTKTLILTLLLPFAFYLTPLLSPAQWSQQNSGTDLDLKSICFTDNENGWAVGSEGIILHTTDGGDNWNEQPSGTDYNLESVRFKDPLNGWIAGGWWSFPRTGIIMRTYNGGFSWEEMYIDTAYYLNDIYFTDSLHGWAVGAYSYYMGQYGTILHSDDGGITWNRQESFTWSSLQSIHFTDPDTGWVVGGYYNGSTGYPHCSIHKTTNGGITWEVQINTIGIYSPLTSVYFTDAEYGWAVGRNYTFSMGPVPNILRTNNGGTQWDSTLYNGTNGPEYSLESVCFINKNTGWAVGGMNWFISHEFSIILHTQDGGDSWKEQAAGTKQMLNSVCFVNAEEGWIAADSGTILHTDNGGIVGLSQHDVSYSKLQLKTYPNPADRIMNIEYVLARSGAKASRIINSEVVSLNVFDIYGQEIATLVNETQPAGEYTVRVNTSDLPAGLYLVRLHAGKESATGKILVVH